MTATAMPTVAEDRGGPAQPLLSIRGLTKTFSISGGMFGSGAAQLRAVDRIDFEVLKGETLGVVGESGCGKSTTARVLMQLIAKDDGEILFDGERVGSSRRVSSRPVVDLPQPDSPTRPSVSPL